MLVLQCVAVCRVLQCVGVAVCCICRVLQCVSAASLAVDWRKVPCNVLQIQGVVVYCSVLQFFFLRLLSGGKGML